MIYSIRPNGNEHGTVYTRPEIVNYILNSVGLFSSNNFYTKKILDPSVGEGAFIIPIIKRILKDFSKDKKNIIFCLQNITAFEIDIDKYNVLLKKLDELFDTHKLRGYEKYINLFNEDYLLATTNTFDIIIGNPPYIRYDKIPDNKKNYYRQLFSCFKYRCDIYISFFEKGLRTLNKNGILSFICPDRWLNNQYGKPLRVIIKDNFYYKEIIRLENFNPFNEEVITYPAIITIQNSRNKKTNYYTATSIQSLNSSNIRKSAKEIKVINSDGELIFSDINTTFLTIEEQGFKIGIGVASGADKIFIINKEDNNIENEILVPLLTRKDIQKEEIVWKSNYMINPFDRKTGKLIDLSLYPNLSKYLYENKDKLVKRHIAKKNQKNWYRTIDRININIISKPKLLIPDISKKNVIYFDEGHYYPHHNFYYIVGGRLTDLLVLRAFLSTKFVEKQIKEKCTLMYGGALRRQAQTLRKIKIPNIQLLSEGKKDKIISDYKNGSMKDIDIIIESYHE